MSLFHQSKTERTMTASAHFRHSAKENRSPLKYPESSLSNRESGDPRASINDDGFARQAFPVLGRRHARIATWAGLGTPELRTWQTDGGCEDQTFVCYSNPAASRARLLVCLIFETMFPSCLRNVGISTAPPCVPGAAASVP